MYGVQPSFTELSAPLFDVTFCVLDLETTGGSPRDCRITEIGAVKYRGGDRLGVFQTLVDPGLPIPPSITILTGITEMMLVDAPQIETALPSFLEFAGDTVLVGHNVRFDLGFLSAAIDSLGYPALENQTLDTAALARRLIQGEVRNLRLQTLARHFRSPVPPIHRALDDALATAHVFHALLERAGTLGVTNLDDLLALRRSRGAAHYRKIDLTNDIPRKPGVYIFRDRLGEPIYVGKATDLRGRVRQYFHGDTRRMVADMLRELHSIDVRVCRSGLEAEITEIRLIHTHRPRYNRRSRPPRASHFVKVTKERFPRLSMVTRLSDKGLAHLGPFRSRRAAEEVVMALWDAVPIRRCLATKSTQTGKCAAAQIGVTRCPCDGTMDIADYETVVEVLLTGIRTRPELLLEPLVERMRRLADAQRFEEAAWTRDRHDALARSLQMRRNWQSLVDAGTVELETVDGMRVVIDRGRYSHSGWGGLLESPPRLTEEDGAAEIPPTVEVAEEAEIVWKWLERAPVRLVEASGSFTSPARRLDRLRVTRAA
jgi:DNA polymerase-3 subunit epsilon